MMGPTHSAFAAATWTALAGGKVIGAPIALSLVPGVETPAALAFGAVVAAGAGLLPDIDHPSATIARSLPPVSTALSHLVSALTGGHRGYTHTLLGALAVFAFFYVVPVGTWSATVGGVGPLGLGVALTVLILGAFASKALKVSFGPLGAWPSALLAAVVAAFVFPHGVTWLAWAVMVGYLSHLVGDIMTTKGLAVARPLSKKSVRVPIIGD